MADAGPSPEPGPPAEEPTPPWAIGSAPAPAASEPAASEPAPGPDVSAPSNEPLAHRGARPVPAPRDGAHEPDEAPRERFLHERLIGSAARALAVSLGLSPASLYGILTNADGEDLLELHLGAFACTLPIFFLERRDRWRWGPVLGRAALGGAIGILLAMMTSMWIRFAGDPGSAFGLFQGRVLRVLPQLLGLALGVGVFAPLWALPFLVRARTARPGPLVAACLLLALALVTPVIIGERLRAKLLLGCGAVVLTGALVPLLVLVAEARLRARGDPSAPLPADADPSRRVAVWGLLVLLALALAAQTAHYSFRPGESSAIGSLKALTTAEVMFSQADKNSDGTLDYAGNLGDLRDDGSLIDTTLASGVKVGYVFRLTRPAGEAGLSLWAAAADPAVLGPGHARRFWVNQAGQIFYTSAEAPAATLDPMKPPAGWQVLGK